MKESAVILQASYTQIYRKDVGFSSFDERLQVQKTAYLLQEMGLNIGEYGYRWYKHGPYSQEVQDDAYYISSQLANVKLKAEKVQFNSTASEILERFKSILKSKQGYDDGDWLEAIASIHYLTKYKLSLPNKQQVIERLKELKPHLADDTANNLAYEVANKI